MKDWTRKIPHPSYGNWCGATNTHRDISDAIPKDDGDHACYLHDMALRKAKTDKGRKMADNRLAARWKKFKPSSIYGKLYRFFVIRIFS